MTTANELTAFFNRILEPEKFPGDVSNNGLQVEGDREVNKVMFAVDACQEVFELAAGCGADYIFVHHGISWGPCPKFWTGHIARQFRTLFQNGISLYGAHLPLDAHPQYGNNAVLCDFLKLQNRRPFYEWNGCNVAFSGELPEPLTPAELISALENRLDTKAAVLNAGGEKIFRCAVVTGSGGVQAITEAAAIGADTLITGELDHRMYHPARELGIKVIAAGHYATETVGPQEMMRLTAEKFAVETTFADVPTGL